MDSLAEHHKIKKTDAELVNQMLKVQVVSLYLPPGDQARSLSCLIVKTWGSLEMPGFVAEIQLPADCCNIHWSLRPPQIHS